MQMQLGYCTVTVVEPLQLLATAPDLAYLKDATVLIKELHDFLNAAKGATPEGSNTTALMQVRVKHLLRLECPAAHQQQLTGPAGCAEAHPV